MKLWNSLKLTFYYGICLTIANGKIFSFKQRSFPLYLLTGEIPSENYNTLSIAKSNPRKSDFVRHSDMSDNTVLSSRVDSNREDNFHIAGDILKNVENQSKDKYLKANGAHDNANFNHGKQIALQGDTSIASDNMESPTSRVKRSVDSTRSVDLSLLTNLTPLHRYRRGFRSAVADRIAHGFGKRGQGLNIHESVLDKLRDTLSQVHLGRAQELLSLQPEDLEEIESVLKLYDNVLAKLRKSSDRYGILNEDRDTLGEIYEKLLSELHGSRYDNPRSVEDESYVNRRYR